MQFCIGIHACLGSDRKLTGETSSIGALRNSRTHRRRGRVSGRPDIIAGVQAAESAFQERERDRDRLNTRVGITEPSYAPTTIHVVIPAKAGTQLRAWVPAFGNVIQSQFPTCRLRRQKPRASGGFLLRSLGEFAIPQQSSLRLRCPFPNPKTPLGDWITSPFAGMTTRGTKRHRQMKHLFRLGHVYPAPKILTYLISSTNRHGRAWSGHPRLCYEGHEKTWMAGSSPAMTTVARILGESELRPLVLHAQCRTNNSLTFFLHLSLQRRHVRRNGRVGRLPIYAKANQASHAFCRAVGPQATGDAPRWLIPARNLPCGRTCAWSIELYCSSPAGRFTLVPVAGGRVPSVLDIASGSIGRSPAGTGRPRYQHEAATP